MNTGNPALMLYIFKVSWKSPDNFEELFSNVSEQQMSSKSVLSHNMPTALLIRLSRTHISPQIYYIPHLTVSNLLQLIIALGYLLYNQMGRGIK